MNNTSQKSSWRTYVTLLLLLGIVFYLLFGVMLYSRQDAMLFFPDQTPFANCPELADAVQVDMNGTRGYYFRNGTSTTLAVVYHGNGGRACWRTFYRAPLEMSGYSWVFVEYTGYAGDGRSPSIEGILADARHVHEWITDQGPTQLVIIGESIGSGPASYHAALASPDTLVLIAPLDRLSTRVKEIFPIYPIRFMLKADLDNRTWARSAHRVLVVNGRNDIDIPSHHGKQLFDSLPQKDKSYRLLLGLDHNATLGSPYTAEAILEFLSE